MADIEDAKMEDAAPKEEGGAEGEAAAPKSAGKRGADKAIDEAAVVTGKRQRKQVDVYKVEEREKAEFVIKQARESRGVGRSGVDQGWGWAIARANPVQAALGSGPLTLGRCPPCRDVPSSAAAGQGHQARRHPQR